MADVITCREAAAEVTVPLVVRTADGGGPGFGAQRSQATENWALTVPGLKIVAPATPAEVTLVALDSMMPVALQAAARLAEDGDGIEAEAVDLRSLLPLDMSTVLASLGRASRLVTVEEQVVPTPDKAVAVVRNLAAY